MIDSQMPAPLAVYPARAVYAALREQALDMIKAGTRKSQIARELGLSESVVYAWAKSAKPKAKRHYNTVYRSFRDQAVEAVRQGATYRQVALLHGVSTSTVRNWCREVGVCSPLAGTTCWGRVAP